MTDTKHWDDKIDYLKSTRWLYFNEDYLEFLVKQVWKFTDHPIKLVDFGCGYGDVGLKLLPLLPEGSHYTGIDKGPQLIETARQLFSSSPYASEFMLGDVMELRGEQKADAAICQAVLLHMPDPKRVLETMREFVRPGGKVICIEPHWNSSMANLYFHEMEQTNTFTLGILQKLYHSDMLRSGKDGNIGVKLPIYMSELGFKDVESRVSDRVNYLHPGLDEAHRDKLFRSMSEDGLGRVIEKQEVFVQGLMGRGLSREEAEQMYKMEAYMSEQFREHGLDRSSVCTPSMKITYGTV